MQHSTLMGKQIGSIRCTFVEGGFLHKEQNRLSEREKIKPQDAPSPFRAAKMGIFIAKLLVEKIVLTAGALNHRREMSITWLRGPNWNPSVSAKNSHGPVLVEHLSPPYTIVELYHSLKIAMNRNVHF